MTLSASVEGDEQSAVQMSLEIPEGSRKEVTMRLPEPRGLLAVTVVDDHDWPIAAAQVSASSLSADAPLRTTSFTDQHGDASLKRARGLPLRIEASAPGHAPRAVTTDESSDAVRIALAPAETASGEVVATRGGDAIAGADVTLYTDLGVRRAHTNARGTFALGELAPGGGSLRVRAPGFAAASRSVIVPDSAGQRPFVIPRLELAAEGVVEGDVVDARGDPVAGARVARDHAPTWLVVGMSPEGVAVTDARGRFSVGELPEGTVALEAYAPDLGRGRVEGVKVVAERTTSNVHIALTAPAAVEERERGPTATGSIAITLGETGAPVQVVVVSVGAASEAEHAGLAPGDVLLAVNDAQVRTIEQAREKLSGPLSDDVVVRVKRGDEELAMRVAREAVRR
ncbi:MAG TPA: carboxypeptidase regulatory-like domain-containing protein [Polyangiaceae bacterium]|nr:carboxypeptidase regulatory-like domain-containing protein [Polyangiaceae bacterium]